MSGSENLEEDVISLKEFCDFETRNMAGCDNDVSCCTFPKGYVNRQALYHCLTCSKISDKQAGICFPCSVHCHDGHILEDLYTKRNFRCDCGNSNFPKNFRCQLWEEKDDVNIKNKYNHNFSGLYCICNSEYDESKDPEEMIQCVICEDWYHLKHLSDSENGGGGDDLNLIDMEEFDEFICKLCLNSRQYLDIYNRANINGLLNKYSATDAKCHFMASKAALEKLASSLPSFNCGAFWMSDWRQSLCRCSNCLELMQSDGTGFLLDNKDTMTHYYTDDRLDDEIQDFLSNLPHSVAIKFAEGVASFKRALTEFLNTVDPDKVITADDVHNFFDKIKRRRFE